MQFKIILAFVHFVHFSYQKRISIYPVYLNFSDNWYGMLHSYSDNKKRCSLMLSLFEPGSSTVPWLGDLKKLGALNESKDSQNPDKPDEPLFPLAASSQRSYRSQSNAVWIKASGLQVCCCSTLQLRH